MADLISRQAAVDALEWKWAGKAAIDAIKNLPSAQPERQKGEWKTEWHYFFHVDLPICSYCLQFSPFKYDFCPRCGADMREVVKVNDNN